MKKGILAGAAILSMILSVPTAFAQESPFPQVVLQSHREFLGQTREQLIQRLGKETTGNCRESFWILKQDKDTQGRETLWIVYDKNQKAILCQLRVEEYPYNFS